MYTSHPPDANVGLWTTARTPAVTLHSASSMALAALEAGDPIDVVVGVELALGGGLQVLLVLLGAQAVYVPCEGQSVLKPPVPKSGIGPSYASYAIWNLRSIILLTRSGPTGLSRKTKALPGHGSMHMSTM